MPPAGLPHPGRRAAKGLHHLSRNRTRPVRRRPSRTPGTHVIHRLNRSEYSNAIRDLLALDIDPGSKLPADDSGYGFDNIGDVLSLSPVLIERYMSVAAMVAAWPLAITEIKPQSTFSRPPASSARRLERCPGARATSVSATIFLSIPPADFPSGTPSRSMPNTSLRSRPGGPGWPGARGDRQALELRIPVKAGVRHVSLTFMRSERNAAKPIPGWPMPAARAAGRFAATAIVIWTFGWTARDSSSTKFRSGPTADLDELSIAGPYNILGAGDTPSRQQIFVCKPARPQKRGRLRTQNSARSGAPCLPPPVTEADLKPLLAFYDSGRKRRRQLR